MTTYKTIGDLPAADAATAADVLEISQGGISRSIMVGQISPGPTNGGSIDATWYGARGDWNDTTQSGTDNATAINAALQYAKSIGGADVVLPVAATGTQANGTGYYTTQPIVVPERCRLIGAGTRSGISHAVRIVGALATSPIVYLNGGTSGNRGTSAINFAVTRANGTVPSTCDGVKVSNSQYARIERVLSMRSAFAFHIDNAATCTLMRECSSTVISVAHVLWTSGPVLTIEDCSFGMSGLDIACAAYIRIDQTVGGPHGPGIDCDTLNCIRTQFNLSDPADTGNADALVEFINGADPNGIYNFVACHVEGLSATGSAIKADAGTTAIRNLSFSQTTISKHPSATNFFSGVTANTLRAFAFSAGSSTTFAMNLPSGTTNGLYTLSGCYLLNGISCAGTSQLAISGAMVNGAVSFSGNYSTFALTGNSFVSATFADTSTGDKYWAGNASSSGSPTIPEWFNGVVKFPEFGDCGGAVGTLTGTTAKTALKTVTIPAKSLGANGYLEVDCLWDGITNNANNKTITVEFGGVAYTNLNVTTQLNYKINTIIYNQNSVSAQKGQGTGLGGGGWGGGGGASGSGAVNTDADASVVISATLAVGTDSITLAGFAVKAHYRP
jgi:hypothetical protein